MRRPPFALVATGPTSTWPPLTALTDTLLPRCPANRSDSEFEGDQLDDSEMEEGGQGRGGGDHRRVSLSGRPVRAPRSRLAASVTAPLPAPPAAPRAAPSPPPSGPHAGAAAPQVQQSPPRHGWAAAAAPPRAPPLLKAAVLGAPAARLGEATMSNSSDHTGYSSAAGAPAPPAGCPPGAAAPTTAAGDLTFRPRPPPLAGQLPQLPVGGPLGSAHAAMGPWPHALPLTPFMRPAAGAARPPPL